MKIYIRSAETDRPSAEDRLNDLLSILKDNFDFAISGIEKIAADGNYNQAIEQAQTLNQMIDGAIGEIAEDIAQ